MTKVGRKDEAFVRVPCIYYPIWFEKDINNTEALSNLSSEVNTMTLAYVLKLGFCMRRTDMSVK